MNSKRNIFEYQSPGDKFSLKIYQNNEYFLTVVFRQHIFIL
jgi:hypothetical protein